jgi:hypothetical protein
MAYSTPSRSLMFSKVVVMSQGHSVSSLSQPQSASTARRKGDTRPLKGNVAKKKRSKLDTNDGSPQKGNTAKKKRGNLGTGYEATGKRSANTLTEDDANYDDEEERKGKNDAWNEVEYDDKEDVLPVTDAPFGVRRWEERRLAEFNTGTVVAAHRLEFIQRAFPPEPANIGKKKPRVLPLHLLKLAGRRVRLTTLCISR